MSALVDLRVPDEDEDPLLLEALDLFDRCLKQSDVVPILAFIEQLLAEEPPALDLLRRFGGDLQQRLLSLRTQLYDERDLLVSTLHASYAVDITPLMPAEALSRLHLVEPSQVAALAQRRNPQLDAAELGTLTTMITNAITAAGNIQREVDLTQSLHTLVLDWLDALSVVASREYWDEFPSRRGLLH